MINQGQTATRDRLLARSNDGVFFFIIIIINMNIRVNFCVSQLILQVLKLTII